MRVFMFILSIIDIIFSILNLIFFINTGLILNIFLAIFLGVAATLLLICAIGTY